VLVEGEALSVRENDVTIYLDLGRRCDFTVTIYKRLQREIAAAGIDLNRVCGWIEQHRGFVIPGA